MRKSKVETKENRFVRIIFPYIIIGMTIVAWVVCNLICKTIKENENKNEWNAGTSTFKEQTKNDNAQEKNAFVLELVDTITTATVYNAVPSQCNNDCTHPANCRFTIDLNNPGAHKIVAFERTFANALNLKFGDIVYIEGTSYDGFYQYHDRMNKRFKGQHKIDLLVDNSIRYGKWTNVKLYKVNGTEEQLETIRREHFLSSL